MYDELEGGLLFREQKDTGGEPSLGIKRVLRSAMVWVVVTAMLVYRSGPSTRAAAHLSSEHLFPFLSFFFFFFFFYLAFVVRRPATPNRSTLSQCARKDHEMFREVLYVHLVRCFKSKLAQNLELHMAI